MNTKIKNNQRGFIPHLSGNCLRHNRPLCGVCQKGAGFSTIEIVLAFAIIIVVLSAIILVVFGNQTVAVDNEINNEALYKAKEIVETARADAKEDFYGLAGSTSLDDIYTKVLGISDINLCKKSITGTVSWQTEPDRPLEISINSEVSSIFDALALGGDCGSDTPPISEWWFPRTFKDYDLKTIEPPAEQSGNAGVPATSIDVVKQGGSKYAVLSTAHNSENDIWIINVDDSLNAFIVSSLETESVGLNTADVAGGLAYALSVGSPTTQPSELQIIDISTVSAPALLATKSLDIFGADAENSPNANTIYYFDEKIYVGTHKTGGKEFQIFSGVAPYEKVAELEINHNINDIVVRGDYAYLATSDDGYAINGGAGELMVVNINPLSPEEYMVHPDVTGMWYDATKGFDAISLYLLGNKIYLGRQGGNYVKTEAFNFMILDITDPHAITELGSKFIPTNESPNKAAGIKDFQIVSDFAFIATDVDNLDFQVYRVSDPTNILNCSELTPPPASNCGKYDFPAKMVDLEFSDNLIYAAIESNATFRIIFDDITKY
ncbi:MAG: hypothetical protein Q8Q06_02395 [bacterium]|nr:hypothetical protein [bacterium]